MESTNAQSRLTTLPVTFLQRTPMGAQWKQPKNTLPFRRDVLSNVDNPCGLARNAARNLKISSTRAGNARVNRSQLRFRLTRLFDGCSFFFGAF
jgi:hypothetical protein